MAQPQMARITCSECNAWYNSERELRDHMQSEILDRSVPVGTSQIMRWSWLCVASVLPSGAKTTFLTAV